MLNTVKRTGRLIVLGLFIALILVSPALSAPAHKAVFVVGQAGYTADDQAKQMDAVTFIDNSRIYVPVRYLAYALGIEDKNIVWNAEEGSIVLMLKDNKTITSGSRTVTISEDILVQLKVGSDILIVTNQLDWHRQMDVKPIIKDGRTYLPARWVAEAFGYKVDWEPESQAVLVHPPVEETPAAD